MKEKRDKEIATIEAVKYLLDQIDYDGIERILMYLQRRYRDNIQATNSRTTTLGYGNITVTNKEIGRCQQEQL